MPLQTIEAEDAGGTKVLPVDKLCRLMMVWRKYVPIVPCHSKNLVETVLARRAG